MFCIPPSSLISTPASANSRSTMIHATTTIQQPSAYQFTLPRPGNRSTMILAPTIQQHSAYQQFTLPRPAAGMMSLPSVSSVSSAMKSNFTQAILAAEMQSRPNMFIPSMHHYNNPQFNNPSLIHRLRLEAMQGELASRSAPHPSHWLAAQQQSLIAAQVDQQRGFFLQNLGSPQVVASRKNSPAAGLNLLQSSVLEATSEAGTFQVWEF